MEGALEAFAKPSRMRNTPTPLKTLGASAEGEVRVMSGRYGPYVSDGKTNATLPKGTDPEGVSLEQAVELLKAKAAQGPTKKRRFVRRKK